MQKPKTPVSRDGLTRETILEYCAGPRAASWRGLSKLCRPMAAVLGAIVGLRVALLRVSLSARQR
jgi:hypothetical protein